MGQRLLSGDELIVRFDARDPDLPKFRREDWPYRELAEREFPVPTTRSPMTEIEIPPDVDAHARTAWVPRTEESDGELGASKFCGRPWLAADEAWPPCPNCDRPLQLFLQLDLTELPAGAQEVCGDEGLLQLFYCVSSNPMCELDCEAYLPFARSVVARWVEDPSGPTNRDASGPDEPFPARKITGWRPTKDLPGWLDLTQELDGEVSDAVADRLAEAGFPLTEDKLGGWPAWVQGLEYPQCPECGDRMEVIFQIDSEDNVPHMFGDAGTGHLSRCPSHPHVLTFSWACY